MFLVLQKILQNERNRILSIASFGMVMFILITLVSLYAKFHIDHDNEIIDSKTQAYFNQTNHTLQYLNTCLEKIQHQEFYCQRSLFLFKTLFRVSNNSTDYQYLTRKTLSRYEN